MYFSKCGNCEWDELKQKAHLVPLIADDIIDEESGKILAIHNVNHL